MTYNKDMWPSATKEEIEQAKARLSHKKNNMTMREDILYILIDSWSEPFDSDPQKLKKKYADKLSSLFIQTLEKLKGETKSTWGGYAEATKEHNSQIEKVIQELKR